MSRFGRRVLRAGMVAVGLASVGAGLLIAAYVTRSRLIEGVPTPALIGLLGLLVLPGLTLGAMEIHRRAARIPAGNEPDAEPEPALSIGPTGPEPSGAVPGWSGVHRDAPSVGRRAGRWTLHRRRAARASR